MNLSDNLEGNQTPKDSKTISLGRKNKMTSPVQVSESCLLLEEEKKTISSAAVSATGKCRAAHSESDSKDNIL